MCYRLGSSAVRAARGTCHQDKGSESPQGQVHSDDKQTGVWCFSFSAVKPQCRIFVLSQWSPLTELGTNETDFQRKCAGLRGMQENVTFGPTPLEAAECSGAQNRTPGVVFFTSGLHWFRVESHLCSVRKVRYWFSSGRTYNGEL